MSEKNDKLDVEHHALCNICLNCRDMKAEREKAAVAGMLTLYVKVSIRKCQFIV